jgi:hypothetical protein
MMWEVINPDSSTQATPTSSATPSEGAGTPDTATATHWFTTMGITNPTLEDQKAMETLLKRATLRTPSRAKQHDKLEIAIRNWISETVNKTRMLLIYDKLHTEHPRGYTIAVLVNEIRAEFRPSTDELINQAREEYRIVLGGAGNNGIRPQDWLRDWAKAYHIAKRYSAPEVQGDIAAKDFINAVRQRIAPQWAERRLDDMNQQVIDPTRTKLTLPQLQRDLMLYLDQQPQRTGRGMAFATLGNSPQQDQSPAGCLCGRSHKWPPETCGAIEYALTGKTSRGIRIPSARSIEHIKKMLVQPK